MAKILYSIMLSLFTVKVYSYFNPFISDSDDTLAEVINWVIVFVLIGSLVASMEAFDTTLGPMMVGINLICVIIIFWLVVVDIHREKVAISFAFGEAEKAVDAARISLRNLASLCQRPSIVEPAAGFSMVSRTPG